MIWFLFAAMTLAALLALLWPLRRARAGQGGAGGGSLHLFDAQVEEINRDLAAGKVAPGEAKAARTEAARRLLTEQDAPALDQASAPRRAAAGAVVAACCLAAALLYSRIGSPALPDLPLASRRAPTNGMDFAAALARIETHLAREPDDLRGWSVIAPVFLRLGRAEDAVRAYGNILRLGGENADRRADYAEAQVYAANGTVTADARRDLETALSVDPKEAKARYYLGLAATQDGDADKARTIWTALATDLPDGSPLAVALKERTAELDGSGATPKASISAQNSAAVRDMASSVAAMPEADQKIAIRGMVERLADRLRGGSGSVDEWLRLVRAYRVLNEADKARAALSDARRVFASDDAARGRLDALARELGLEG